METFSPKLDRISENIVYELSLNSRESVSKIAKKLNLSRKMVEHRIKLLFEKKLFRPLLVYNHSKLIKATVLIKLLKFDDTVIKSIIKLNKFMKIKETLGQYDLSLFIVTNSKQNLENAIKKIDMLLHERIKNMYVITHDIEDCLGFKSFCHTPSILVNYKFMEYDPKYRLNDNDYLILSVLEKDPLMPYNEIIKKTGLNYKTIKEIVENLLAKKIIRFSLDPDYRALGLEFHNILVKIKPSKKEEFESNIMNCPNIHWIKRSSGRWDYILSVTAKEISEFIEITRTIRTDNESSILDFSVLISNIHLMRTICRSKGPKIKYFEDRKIVENDITNEKKV